MPKINGVGTQASGGHWYDFYTGQGPKGASDEGWYSRTDETHNYNTPNGELASTTGNVIGIYDMNGGTWERVAGYLDNRNENLNTYGKSADGSIKYFESGKINPTYASLWNKYEVSEEEKTNKISIRDGTTLTQFHSLHHTEKILIYGDGSKQPKKQQQKYKIMLERGISMMCSSDIVRICSWCVGVVALMVMMQVYSIRMLLVDKWLIVKDSVRL